MSKVHKFSQLTPTLPFTEYDFISEYRQSFLTSELGKLHSLFPFSSISKKLQLKECKEGRSSYFSPEGKVALMLLKSYTRFSDRELISNLNSNIHYQLFCGIRLNPLSPLTNYKIVSDIRCEIGNKLKISELEKELSSCWKPYLSDLNVVMMDATCYPTHLRYPTSPKLLWESVSWIYKELQHICKVLKIPMPRTKYLGKKKMYNKYSKQRKRKKSITRRLKRSLLHLLDKLLAIIDSHLSTFKGTLELQPRFYKRLSDIKRIYKQQSVLFAGGDVKDRIVSIDKSYIHPIVRGKEKVAVEFGAKVNAIQCGGINFIEKLSFSAYNECTRLKSSVEYAQQLFRKKISFLAGDAIYGTNKNRTYCTSKNITTSFVRKGKESIYEAQRRVARIALSKERATRLEGSFGIEKEKYGLNKIKARTKQSEIVWIFFGIHTANAVRMISKVEKYNLEQVKQLSSA